MRIIPIGDGPEPTLSPDLVWDGVMADLVPSGQDEDGNRGGLAARAALDTAVLICLMSDARVAADELRAGDVNRGWIGDGFDVDAQAGEAPIGSRLWLLARRTVDDAILPRLAEDYAVAALAPLIAQGAAALATARATADPSRNRLDLAVELTDRAGQVVVASKFRVLWDAT